MSQTANRVIKNTGYLYMKMAITMFVSLYTTRLILNSLGASDFGIYNIVGGVISMLGFLNAAMASSTQRFMNYAEGEGNNDKKIVIFNISIVLHVLVAAIVGVMLLISGVLFFNGILNIPDARIFAAKIVYASLIISTMVTILTVPYDAVLNSHENMKYYSIVGVFESLLKLVVAFACVYTSEDKLIVYGLLMATIPFVSLFIMAIYCHKRYSECCYRIRKNWDKEIAKDMTGFAGWSMFGNLSAVLFGQGLNMLLNVFFGPVVNAARGIAVQVQNAIQQFVGNFQMALNPQITKTYAKGELSEMHKLMFRSARFSFFLLFFLSLPVLFETDFILTVWLKTVPDNTIVFLRIMICTSLIYTLSNPLIVANQATGDVKRYQAVCGTILLMILPVSYVCLRLRFPAYSVFIVHFLMESLTQMVRMFLLRPLIGIRIRDYFRYIYLPVLLVIAISVILPTIVYFNMDDTVVRFLVVGIVCVLSVSVAAYTLGLSRNEQLFVKTKAISLLQKFTRK